MGRRKWMGLGRRKDAPLKGHHKQTKYAPASIPPGIYSPRWKEAKWAGLPFVIRLGKIRVSKGVQL